ncbi:MAG: cation:proton antiporter [Gemmatimonadota bacterium]|nr:cation:proton antiporter [Gemmatimonadota bacterium]
MALTILSIGLLVFAGHFLTGLFERTKVPDVLILMLAGMILGPGLQIVTPADFGKVGSVFTTLALVVILFEGGIHLNIKDLGRAASDTIFISVATFALTVLLVTHTATLFLDVAPVTALLMGVILGGTSSAVVVPLIRILKPGDRAGTILLLESALTDVLAVVLALGLIGGLQADTGISAQVLAKEVGLSFLVAAGIGAIGAFVWSAVLPKVRQLPNTVFTTIAYVLILFGITELWGYSGAIASLAFGIGVANLPNIPEAVQQKVISFRLVGFADVERTFFAETVFLVKTFFFVYLGISISFSDIMTVWVGFVVAVVAVLGRSLIVRLLAPKTSSKRDALLMTALIPKGLAAAVLAAIPLQLGIAGGDTIQGIVYSTILFSIVISAALVFVIEGGRLDGMAKKLFRPFAAEADSPHERTVSPFDQSLGLPALPESFQEPNPVNLKPVLEGGEIPDLNLDSDKPEIPDLDLDRS